MRIVVSFAAFVVVAAVTSTAIRERLPRVAALGGFVLGFGFAELLSAVLG